MSFTIIEIAALTAPAAALALVPWLAPERRRRLVAWSVLWLVVFTAGGAVGLRLTPAPLGASALAAAVLAGWVMVFALRPDPERRVARRLYWLMIGGALALNYLVATVGVLGIGFGVARAEPEVRERLAPTVVAYAFRVGGATLDFTGFEVEVRRRLPWFSFLERIERERSYVSSDAARPPLPSFRLEDQDVPAVLVTLGDWAEGLYPSPDTIPLE